MAICPDCGLEFYLEEDDLEVGDIVQCDECSAELEVVAVGDQGATLELASDEDDEDEEYEEVFEENGYYDSDSDEF